MQRRSQSLRTIVQKEIERLIVQGAIKPGQRVNEQRLALRLGVSRGPVREATRALENTGLVVAVPNQGMFVRRISAEEVADLYDVRALAFGFACGLLANGITPQQHAELRDLVDRMQGLIATDKAPGYYNLNLRFHDTIMRFAGHRMLQEMYASAARQLHMARQRSLRVALRMHDSSSEHGEIVTALGAGDSPGARRLAEQHILNGKQGWLKAVAQSGVTPDD